MALEAGLADCKVLEVDDLEVVPEEDEVEPGVLTGTDAEGRTGLEGGVEVEVGTEVFEAEETACSTGLRCT